MESASVPGDPDRLSRPELISLYINGYYQLDADLRIRFEAAFAKRRLPLPRMPATPPPSPPTARAREPIDRGTFLSYILLIYTGTAVIYSWVYLAERLVKMDFHENAKHKLIQSGIALFYVVAEILLYEHFSSPD